MRSQLRIWLAVLLAGLCLTTLTTQAAPVAGRDYRVIQPAQSTDDPGRIEVVEVFSYACPHCNELNPYIHKWEGKLPADVVFSRVPVNFNPFYLLMARLYYSLEEIGELKRLDSAVFSAIHEKGVKLIDDQSILEWVTSQGVDAKKFSTAYNSFAVANKVRQADQLARDSKLQGVPALVVDGRYRVVGKNMKSIADLLVIRQASRQGAPGTQEQNKEKVTFGQAVPAGPSLFITGASSGIGNALAQHYARQGAVLGLAARRQDFLERIAGELAAAGAKQVYPRFSISPSPKSRLGRIWLAVRMNLQHPIGLASMYGVA